MKIDLYTKSILTVLAIAVLLNASNPWSLPISKWAEFHDSTDWIETQHSPISSSIIAVAVLLNAMNPWVKPLVVLAKSYGNTERHPDQT